MKNGMVELEITMGGGQALLENAGQINENILARAEQIARQRNKGSKYPTYLERKDIEDALKEAATKK